MERDGIEKRESKNELNHGYSLMRSRRKSRTAEPALWKIHVYRERSL